MRKIVYYTLQKSNAYYLSLWENSNNCCYYLCFVYNILSREKKKEIWLSRMTKPLYQQKMRKPKNNTQNSITQQLNENAIMILNLNQSEWFKLLRSALSRIGFSLDTGIEERACRSSYRPLFLVIRKRSSNDLFSLCFLFSVFWVQRMELLEISVGFIILMRKNR